MRNTRILDFILLLTTQATTTVTNASVFITLPKLPHKCAQCSEGARYSKDVCQNLRPSPPFLRRQRLQTERNTMSLAQILSKMLQPNPIPRNTKSKTAMSQCPKKCRKHKT